MSSAGSTKSGSNRSATANSWQGGVTVPPQQVSHKVCVVLIFFACVELVLEPSGRSRRKIQNCCGGSHSKANPNVGRERSLSQYHLVLERYILVVCKQFCFGSRQKFFVFFILVIEVKMVCFKKNLLECFGITRQHMQSCHGTIELFCF